MASYYTSTTTFDLGAESENFLDNKNTRITQKTLGVLGEGFWSNYSTHYANYISTEKLLFRAKIVKDSKVHIKQIWASEEDRTNFANDVNETAFNAAATGLGMSREFSTVDAANIDSWIDSVLAEENKILQYVCDDMKRSGMIIGDPLKDDEIIVVE